MVRGYGGRKLLLLLIIMQKRPGRVEPFIGVGRAAFGACPIRATVFERVQTLRADAVVAGAKARLEFAFAVRPDH